MTTNENTPPLIAPEERPYFPEELTPGSFVTGPFVRERSAVGYPVGPICAVLVLGIFPLLSLLDLINPTDSTQSPGVGSILGTLISIAWIPLALYTIYLTCAARRVRRWEAEHGRI